ncbi:MAG: hypothetical protein KatS3mg110_0538 [Pirellulaceae bacterium]|nr:MAG: hypothetical protein KatS3mg110_0538 [Pirellulaceae bacterium]
MSFWGSRHWCWALGGLAAAYFGLWFLPGQRRLQTIKQQVASDTAFLESTASLPSQVAELQERLQSARRFCQQWETTAPRDEQLATFFPRLTDAAAAHQVELLAVVPQNPKRDDLIATYPLELRCRATFHALGKFLAEVDRFPEPLLIEALEITRSPEDGQTLSCTMTLSIFGYSAGNSD